MAISAKFVADFNSFFTEVDKTINKLTGLNTTADSVSRQLGKMGTSFSGKNIFQEAETAVQAVNKLGGASKLTTNEQHRLNGIVTEALAKYRALGQDAPKHLTDIAKATTPIHAGFSSILGILKSIGPALGIAFSVGGLVSFGKSIADFSGKMLDLEAQTNLTTNRLQAFDFIGGDVGLTVEDITTSADQLAKRLGGNDASVNAALEDLNLSGSELTRLQLDEVMFAIDKALVGVNNQFERANILNDLFGRSGARLGRLMTGSLEEIIKKTEETGPIIEKELLEKADRFGEMWEHAWKRFQAAAVDAIDVVAGLVDDLVTKTANFLRNMPRGFGGIGQGSGFLPRGLGGFPERGAFEPERAEFVVGGPLKTPATSAPVVSKTFLEQLRMVDDQIKKLTATQRAQIDSALKLGESHARISEKLGIEEKVLQRYIGLKQEATKGLRDEAKAAKEAEDAWKPYIELLDKRGKLESELIHSVTSVPTKKLRELMLSTIGVTTSTGSRVQVGTTPGILPNLNAGLTSGLIFSPGQLPRNGGAGFGSILTELSPKSFLGGITGGFKDLLGGMTGGKGVGGFLNNLGGGIVKGFGDILSGGITSLISTGIGFVGKGFSKLFGGLLKTEGKQTNRERDAEIAAFTGISGDKFGSQDAFRKMATEAGIAASEVDRLFSTGKIKNFQAEFDRMTAKIQEFTSEQEADQERLNAALEKYGLTIEHLGEGEQQKRLNDQAKELIEDWRVLIGAGVEITDVNNAMSDAINEYLQMAVKLGTEVPSAMRPILQKMLEQGTLTDEAGNAITDLEAAGIKFSETMTEGFDKVVKKLEELIEKIGLANVELGSLSVPSVPSGIWNPNQGQGDIVEGSFAGGTKGRYLNFSSGTTVRLHGRERVMTEAEGRAESGAWGAIVAEVSGLRRDMSRFTEGIRRTMRDEMLIAMGQRV